MQATTKRLESNPGGLDQAKVTQVRLDFSSPPRTVAPHNRLQALSSGRPGLVETREESQKVDCTENVFGKCELGGRGPGGYRW